MRRSRAIGVWALVCALIAPVWLFGGLYAVLFSGSSEVPPLVGVLAAVASFGWFVVPLAAVAAIVLAGVAIALRRGRGFGVAALLVLLAAGALVVVFLTAAFGGIPA